jgi:hypothetical protein
VLLGSFFNDSGGPRNPPARNNQTPKISTAIPTPIMHQTDIQKTILGRFRNQSWSRIFVPSPPSDSVAEETPKHRHWLVSVLDNNTEGIGSGSFIVLLGRLCEPIATCDDDPHVEHQSGQEENHRN